MASVANKGSSKTSHKAYKDASDRVNLKQGAFWNGGWQIPSNRDQLHVYNPATKHCSDDEPIASIVASTPEDAKNAIHAASKVQPQWGYETPAYKKSSMLRNVGDAILRKQDDLATILSAENGKNLKEASDEVMFSAAYFQFYAETLSMQQGEILPPHAANTFNLATRKPVGIVAAISPFNFPSAVLARKVAPALAAGNAVVAKPAESTPLSAMALASVCSEVLPSGLVNVLVGNPKDVGNAILEDKRVGKLTFTGSTGTGSMLAGKCASSVKRLSLELGGNAPYVVLSDADVDEAVESLRVAKFGNNGQICIGANRVFVHNSLKDEFLAKATKLADSFKVGNALEETVDLGPMNSQMGLEKVENHVKDAVERGAKIHTGGERMLENSLFYKPTVLELSDRSALCYSEETFGPVLAVDTFQTDDEAIDKANDTDYGLAAYVFGRDMNRTNRVVSRIKAGLKGVNMDGLSGVTLPFGGTKQSGYGREGGLASLDDFQETELVTYYTA